MWVVAISKVESGSKRCFIKAIILQEQSQVF